MNDDNVVFDKSKKYLAQTSDNFFLIFNDNELKLFRSSRYIYERLGFEDSLFVNFIAIQYHDKDVVKEENRVETPHYHVVLSLNKRFQFKTMLDLICDLFHCNPNQVGMQKVIDLCACTRYLCHLDNPDKYQYLPVTVVTNNHDLLDRYFNLVMIKDLQDLIGVVKHYNYSLEDIMMNISDYKKWRTPINDLIVNHFRRRIQ